MPIFRIGAKLCYFAHVPKCGGSSVEAYLKERFGLVGFLDTNFTRYAEAERWSRTSPQHIDWTSLQRLVPEAMFDAVFAVVRHPVSRIVSAYHFQIEVERSVPHTVTFSNWLEEQLERCRTDPFAADNHVRPQIDFMPDNCTLFHLEHGLDPIVPYLDKLAGGPDGPRAIGHSNKRTAEGRKKLAPDWSPSAADIALIHKIYARDFEGFGYNLEHPFPSAPRPTLAADYIATRDAERARASRLIRRTAARIRRGIARRIG